MKGVLVKTTGRERTLVLLGVTVTICLLLYSWAGVTLSNSLAQSKREVTTLRSQLAAMEDAAMEVSHLRGPGLGPGIPEYSELPLSLLNETAKLSHLDTSIKQLQPDGKTKVRVSMELADFNDLFTWVQLLEAKGLVVAHFSAERSNLPGLVNAKLTLQLIAVN